MIYLNAQEPSVANLAAETITGITNAYGISSDGTHVWVSTTTTNLYEISAATATLVNTITLPAGSTANGVVSDGTDVWVPTNNSGTGLNDAVEVNASTGSVVAEIPLGSNSQERFLTTDGTQVFITGQVNYISEITNTPQISPQNAPTNRRREITRRSTP